MRNGENSHDQDTATQTHTISRSNIRQTTASSAYIPLLAQASARPSDALEREEHEETIVVSSFAAPIIKPAKTGQPGQPVKAAIQTRPVRSFVITLLLIVMVALALVFIAGGLGLIYYTTVTHPAQVHATATATAQAVRIEHSQATAAAQSQATSTAVAIAHAQATANVQATQRAVQAQTKAQIEATITAQQQLFTQSLQGTPMLNETLAVQTKSNWDIYPTQDGGGCAFTDSMYHVSMHTHGYYTQCMAHKSHVTNFALDVDMTILKGSTGGVLFRSNSGDNNFYNFRIANDGSYALLITKGNKNSTLLYDKSSAIKTGVKQINRITIIAQGANIYLYINAQFVGSVNDTTYSAGSIGFIASEQTKDTDIAFSHLRVWSE